MVKKYKIEYTLDDIDFVFNLASIGYLEILNHPGILEIRSKKQKNSILHCLAMNSSLWGDTKRQFIIDYIINLEGVENIKNTEGSTPLHTLGWKFRKEIFKHPSFNKVKDFQNKTPYQILLKRIPAKLLGDYIIPNELTKPLISRHYLGPVMALDTLIERSHKPSLGQLEKWGLSLVTDEHKASDRISYGSISDFKKRNALRFILE